jgi:hypothetical protein
MATLEPNAANTLFVIHDRTITELFLRVEAGVASSDFHATATHPIAKSLILGAAKSIAVCADTGDSPHLDHAMERVPKQFNHVGLSDGVRMLGGLIGDTGAKAVSA